MEEDIKIIDLLNKIANGEEVPKKIKFNSTEYKYDKGYNDYYSLDVPLTHLLDNNNANLETFLNHIVEIIEDSEKKKIRKFIYDPRDTDYTHQQLADKINELIDRVNELKSNKEMQ